MPRQTRPLGAVLAVLAMLPLLVAPAASAYEPAVAGPDATLSVAGSVDEGTPASIRVVARFVADLPLDHADLPGEAVGLGTWRVFDGRTYETAEQAVARVESDPRFEDAYLEPQYRISASAPNDPAWPDQWHLRQIGLPNGWAYGTGKGAVVAVLDTGVRRGDDLKCKSLAGEYDAVKNVSGSGTARDDNGHGTHVAGTVAQCTDNGHAAAGVAPHSRILAVKVMDELGNGTETSLARGIRWAVDNGAKVINMSLGGACPDGWSACMGDVLKNEIARAVAKDVLLLAAAGNQNANSVDAPAAHPDVMAVAATTSERKRASYSNRGSGLSVAAPGGESWPDLIWQETFCVVPTLGACEIGMPGERVWGVYGMVGTSMATPHVSGLAALMRSAAPKASASTIRQIIESTARDLGPSGFDTSFGHGEIRAVAALDKLLATQVIEFVDVPKDSTFYNAIQWLAQEGITRGCNPPTNDRFCPGDAVTRQQMAAFMVRALGLKETSGVRFRDVPSGSTFEIAIDRLATAGITRGCNPPTNDRFCPGDAVSRQQMAAFMRRALSN